MDTKLTLSFNAAVIDKAKHYAETHNMSLSRMIELLLQKVTSANYADMEEFPVSSWVQELAEGEASYVTRARTRKQSKEAYHTKK